MSRDPFSTGDEPITNASRVLASSTQISPFGAERARVRESARLVARDIVLRSLSFLLLTLEL